MQEKMLEILRKSDGPVSGEQMAAVLGVSRNMIWKTVQKLREQGYEISAVTNRGYQLKSMGNVLASQTVRSYLPDTLAWLDICVQERVTSTNSVLKEAAEQGKAQGTVLIAQEQTAGKGRLGRSFFSPVGTGLYLSLLLRPSCPAQEALSITTAAAVAVSRAIEKTTGIPAQIKWVNDIYVGGKKVCGILTEASVDFETGGLHYAVLGIGVNIQEPQGGFAPELQEVATALYATAVPGGLRARLAAEILTEFFAIYGSPDDKGYMEEYQSRSFLTGLDITFVQGNVTEQGHVLGIDEQARLVVQLISGEKRYYSAGEVKINKDFINGGKRNEAK